MEIILKSDRIFLHYFTGLILTSFLITGCRGLRDVRLEMPEYVRRGNDVRLRCQYDMEGDALYAVKWYKGQEEFYRFVPKEVPPEKVFPLPGLTVDVHNSNDHDVVLLRVSLEITGTYRCVVSAESPFQTLSAAAHLLALVIGDDRPFLQLDRAQYHPGDGVKAICRSPPSNPPANLTWYIEPYEVRREKTQVSYREAGVRLGGLERESRGMTTWTESLISFDLSSAHFHPVRIKCRANVFSAYDQNSSTFTLVPVPRRLSGPDTLLRSSGSSLRSNRDSSHYWRLWALLGITLIISFLSIIIVLAQQALS